MLPSNGYGLALFEVDRSIDHCKTTARHRRIRQAEGPIAGFKSENLMHQITMPVTPICLQRNKLFNKSIAMPMQALFRSAASIKRVGSDGIAKYFDRKDSFSDSYDRFASPRGHRSR